MIIIIKYAQISSYLPERPSFNDYNKSSILFKIAPFDTISRAFFVALQTENLTEFIVIKDRYAAPINHTITWEELQVRIMSHLGDNLPRIY